MTSPHDAGTGKRIVCAAVRRSDGAITCGPRHFDEIMWCQILDVCPEEFAHIKEDNRAELPELVLSWRDAEQGFIDQYGKFYTREDAWLVADTAGQIIETERGWVTGSLHSEHLY